MIDYALARETRAEHAPPKCSDCRGFITDDIQLCRKCGMATCQHCYDKRGCLTCETIARQRMKEQYAIESTTLIRLLGELDTRAISTEEFYARYEAIGHRIYNAGEGE